MRPLRELERFLGHGTPEESLPKALPMNECIKTEL